MQIPNVCRQAMTWKTSLAFISLATAVVFLIGWLSSVGLLPINRTIEHSEAGLKFIQAWIQLAVAIGLVLPTVAYVVWFKYPAARTIFGFYLLLLVIQIVTEQIISRIWLSSSVVVIGTLYTAFRVWQLWQGLQLIKMSRKQSQRKLLRGVLWLLFLFWSSNFIVLLALAWPSIL